MERLSKKDLQLIKDGLRRAFSRSDYRKDILKDVLVKHSDPKRKRVKRWLQCPNCHKKDAYSYFQVDHINPIQGVTEAITDLTPEQLLERIWCGRDNLRPICLTCHYAKSSLENKARRAWKKKYGPSNK